MRKRVLVVDDDKATRTMLLDMLDMLGYEGRAIANADQLKAVAVVFDPHLIILDVTIPGHDDGIAALVRLRDEGILTSVLMYSGQYETREREPMAHYTRVLGGQAFVQKPLDMDDLEVRLKTLIGTAEG